MLADINKIKNKIITTYKINRIIKFIKKSTINAYIIGNEMLHIYSIIYHMCKVTQGNYNVDAELYDTLLEDQKYNTFNISKIFSNNIIYSEFFTKFNIKIFQLIESEPQYTWHYLRGYYINAVDLFIVNLNKFNKSYCVIYDFHPHYITFIYEYLTSLYINHIDINLELNNNYDIYSINDFTDTINYKLIINHNPSDFNNPILDLLHLLYSNIHYTEELIDLNDINTFHKLNKYKS